MAVWMIENCPADPSIFGIDHSKLTERLTPANWRDKAAVRRVDGKVVFANVLLLSRNAGGGEQRMFEVVVYGADERNLWFDGGELEQAIAYANGLGEPVPRSEWPPEEEAPWRIGAPLRPGGRR